MRLFRYGAYAGYGFWFRICGVGLHFCVATEPMLFSERNGYTRTLTIFGWRIKVLL